jgi:hypothetical protein
MPLSYRCFSPTVNEDEIIQGKDSFKKSHLRFEFWSHSILLIRFDDQVKVVEILNDETVFFVHREQYLFDRRVAVAARQLGKVCSNIEVAHHVKRTPEPRDENNGVE